MTPEASRPATQRSALSPAEWVVIPLKTPTLPPATHTNCLIIGSSALTLIDPASPYPEDQEALARYLDERISEGAHVTRVALTHHHPDHIGGVTQLIQRYGCEVWAHAETAKRVPFEVRRHVEDGDELWVGGEEVERLIALHTPGHAQGHLCFINPTTREAIVGDMVAGEGTILIDPDEGDMGLYLSQLARLERLQLSALWPSHGPALSAEVLSRYRAHRLAREQRVLEALDPHEWRGLQALADRAYDDAPTLVRQGKAGGLAGRSVWAHLIKLGREGRALERGQAQRPSELAWRLPAQALARAPQSAVGADMERLHEVMSLVRARCAWMRAQSLTSLKRYLIEETGELLEALELPEERALDAHRDELGDVLLQVVLHAVIREEEGAFSLDDVIQGLTAKLIRRHPHIFAGEQAEGPEEVHALWQKVKAAERAARGASSSAQARPWRPPPAQTPALSRAMELSEAAARFGFDWPDATGALEKVSEEREEILDALARDLGSEALRGELGDLLFAAVNACRLLQIDPARALQSTCERFEARVEGMIQLAESRALTLSTLSLEELEALWGEAKRSLTL